MSISQDHYDATTISFLSDIWGEGFMSPGGAKEADELVINAAHRPNGKDVSGCKGRVVEALALENYLVFAGVWVHEEDIWSP